MSRLANKVAIVTGAAQGIGRAIALRFADEGCHLALSDVNLEGVRETAALAEARGARTLASRVDVTQRDEVEPMVAATIAQLGPVDVLVNNAGIFFNAPFHEMTDEQWRQMMAVNLDSVFLVTQVVVRSWLAAQRGGAIVSLSSMSGIIAFANSAHYCVAKAGVAAMTKCLALEYGKQGIRANALAPGFVETPLTAHLSTSQRELGDAWRAQLPLGRFAQPKEAADLALFLATEESAYITGQTILIDGGWTLQ